MRGRPWLRILLVCFGMVLMGSPVWTLTHSPARLAPEIPAEAAPAATGSLLFMLTFAHAPESFEVTYLGKLVLSGNGPALQFSGPWSGSLPKEGADFLLRVKWPAGTPRTAVEVKVEQGDAVLADPTIWGSGNLTEIVTVLPGPR